MSKVSQTAVFAVMKESDFYQEYNRANLTFKGEKGKIITQIINLFIDQGQRKYGVPPVTMCLTGCSGGDMPSPAE